VIPEEKLQGGEYLETILLDELELNVFEEVVVD